MTTLNTCHNSQHNYVLVLGFIYIFANLVAKGWCIESQTHLEIGGNVKGNCSLCTEGFSHVVLWIPALLGG